MEDDDDINEEPIPDVVDILCLLREHQRNGLARSSRFHRDVVVPRRDGDVEHQTSRMHPKPIFTSCLLSSVLTVKGQYIIYLHRLYY